jgi:hypothetical protein
MERALHDMTIALAGAGDRVDIDALRTVPGTWTIDPDRFQRVPTWRMRGAGRSASDPGARLLRIARPVRRAVSPHYDVHIGFRWSRDITGLVRATRQWVNPSGLPFTPADLAPYDAAAMQAPDNTRLVPVGMPTVLLPPPLLGLADSADRPSGIPNDFILTVFHAQHAIKGGAELASLVETSPLPVVWCTPANAPTVGVADGLIGHPRLIMVHEPTRAQLRYLYEKAYAYVSLSLHEGFGWAIADALRYTPRVFSRRVGVLSFDEALQPGVTVLDPERGVSGVDWDSAESNVAPTDGRDLEWLSARAFRERVVDLLNR